LKDIKPGVFLQKDNSAFCFTLGKEKMNKLSKFTKVIYGFCYIDFNMTGIIIAAYFPKNFLWT